MGAEVGTLRSDPPRIELHDLAYRLGTEPPGAEPAALRYGPPRGDGNRRGPVSFEAKVTPHFVLVFDGKMSRRLIPTPTPPVKHRRLRRDFRA
jgi:hypothetical protein